MLLDTYIHTRQVNMRQQIPLNTLPKHALRHYDEASNDATYPVNKFFKNESKLCYYKNYNMWKQIQPEIQEIANQVIKEIKLVNLAIQEIKKKSPYTSEYEKRITDALYVIFNVGNDRFYEWLNRCDKELNHEYSGELFCYETETNKYSWVLFSIFLDNNQLKSYFNACLLMYAMEITTINDEHIKIIRSNFGHNLQLKTILQEKFKIMDNYYTFQHRWKGSKYYTKAILV